MRTNLTIEDLPGFLDEPLVAVLATGAETGPVQLSPGDVSLPLPDKFVRHRRGPHQGLRGRVRLTGRTRMSPGRRETP